MLTNDKPYLILVIEDNPGDYALIETFLLEKIKATIITHAKSFKEAKHLISADGCPFDIILLDLSLPDKTGESLIRQIIELCSTAPVIVLTGYADFNFGVKSLSFGASDYLLKDDLTAMMLYKSIVYSTERKKSILDLEESERKYSDLFHLSPLPMWVFDINTLQFLDVNRATVAHYGYSRNEFLSMGLKDIRPVSELAKLESAIAQDKQNAESNSRWIMIHQFKNGDLRSVEIQGAPIIFKGIKAYVEIATDITERLTYIKAIEEQNEKLREISWIQSHVVRAPLARIMGLVPLIHHTLTVYEDRELMLDYLLESAYELDLVIRDITEKTKTRVSGDFNRQIVYEPNKLSIAGK
jgi:PAS domain S-box-containing protein